MTTNDQEYYRRNYTEDRHTIHESLKLCSYIRMINQRNKPFWERGGDGGGREGGEGEGGDCGRLNYDC